MKQSRDSSGLEFAVVSGAAAGVVKLSTHHLLLFGFLLVAV
jgi:hypothetical protein